MKSLHIILLILLALFAGINIGGYLYQPPYLQEIINATYDPTSTGGLAAVETKINGTTVFLISGCYAVSFDVTPDQAYSIARGLDNTLGARPLTHDILKDVLDIFNIEILQIRVDRYSNDIYYATIFLRQGNKILELDARPSDSIALALRARVPLYFKQSILEERGTNIC